MTDQRNNLAAIRELVSAAFDDEGLSTFCFDYFRPVYQQFTSGQLRGARIRLLVDYAQHQGQLEKLLALLKEANPHHYQQCAPRLGVSETPASSDESEDTSSGKAAAAQAGQAPATRGDTFDMSGDFRGAIINIKSAVQHRWKLWQGRITLRGIIMVIMVIVGILAIIGLTRFQLWSPPVPTPTATPTFIEYVGRVVNRETNVGIGSAEVALDFEGVPPITYTDSEGIYRFTISFDGDWLAGEVRIEAANYEPYTRHVRLSVHNPRIEDIRLNPIPTPTMEPSNTPTNPPIPPTGTPTPRPPTETPTREAAPTGTPTPTSTPTASATATPTPTREATSTPLPANPPTATISPAQVPTPSVATPAPDGFVYPAPVLRNPVDKQDFAGRDVVISLSWDAIDLQKANDAYLVTTIRHHSPNVDYFDCQITSEPSLKVPTYIYDDIIESRERDIKWYVTVIRNGSCDNNGKLLGEIVSPKSAERSFIWNVIGDNGPPGREPVATIKPKQS